jgi:peptidoglycan/LPS O-acetylase OafA/YrhL
VKGQVTTVPGLEIVADLGLVLYCAAACLGWAAVFLRFTATRRPVIDSLSENAYGIYLVHYLFITWLQYILLGVALFAIAKAAIVFTGTLILSWATSIAMCRVPIGDRLVGANRRTLECPRQPIGQVFRFLESPDATDDQSDSE